MADDGLFDSSFFADYPRVMLTVTALTVVTVAALATGAREIAFGAASALVAYMGKMNGSASQKAKNDDDGEA